MSLHLALVHYPIIDKHGACVATSITNMDIHDICRSARTFGVARVWYVHPYEGQQQFLRTIIGHWQEGWGATYNPNRQEALELAAGAMDLGEVGRRIEAAEGAAPEFIATHAQPLGSVVGYEALRSRLSAGGGRPVCLVFGTGWGLHPEVYDQVDAILEPIYGPGEWNHLSVRAAVAIILDRLAGRR